MFHISRHFTKRKEVAPTLPPTQKGRGGRLQHLSETEQASPRSEKIKKKPSLCQGLAKPLAGGDSEENTK